jgi:hypothetical protein
MITSASPPRTGYNLKPQGPRFADRRLGEGPPQSGDDAADHREIRFGQGSADFPEDRARDLELYFAAFVFVHLNGRGATFELRLGERVLLK